MVTISASLSTAKINAALADPQLKARFADLGGTPAAHAR
jgi:hypothetical protein